MSVHNDVQMYIQSRIQFTLKLGIKIIFVSLFTKPDKFQQFKFKKFNDRPPCYILAVAKVVFLDCVCS